TCFNQILSGYLRGDGDSRMPMIITLCTHVFFRQIYLFVIKRVIPDNVYVIGFGYPAGWILCAFIMTIYYFIHQRRR
ncbi:MAG: MATE family efflux transporter, partial [Synergistaceae bacterium]|nr:MATE family efflux transporter [Synergistaceae bacterium]